MKAIRHFQTITKHKIYVMRECFRVGLYRQGLLHDLSKYSWTEFRIGCRYYQGTRSPNNAEREEKGYSSAWLHHKGRNKHHYEYWIDYNVNVGKDGKILTGMKMPVRYVVEMFLDRIAASKVYIGEVYNDSDPLMYYENGKAGELMHPETRALLNKVKRVQGHTDIPLNEYGRHLARETAEGLKETRIDLAITSPLIRAKETAQIILGTRQIPLLEEPRIREVGFGEYEGVSCNGEDPISRSFRLFFNAPGEYIAPKGAETIEELYERTGDFLKELCEKEEWQEKNILISTHGAAMTALLNRIRGNLSVESFWQEKVPPNCSVTTVQIKNGVPCIVKENEIFYKEKVRQWNTV